MKVFVPKFFQDAPHPNRQILNNMFMEINEKDLPRIIESWKAADTLQDLAGIKALYKTSGSIVCQYPTQKHTLEPFLRRSHITVHCGAKDGADHCKVKASEFMYETGKLVALGGWSLWYGGGDAGKMGDVFAGFHDQIKKHRYPDQYSIQVSPAQFVFGVQSVNGLRPANEGLGKNSDVAIVFPKFSDRREMLDSTCDAAITGFGGTGSLDELTDILVHIKTGLRATRSYIINQHIPELGRGIWDSFRQQMQDFVVCGSENPTTLNHLRFFDSPQEVFTALHSDLDAAGRNPHKLYEEYCLAQGIVRESTRPQKPHKSLSSAATFVPGDE